MKMFEPCKVAFGYMILPQETLFEGCSMNMKEFFSIKRDSGVISQKDFEQCNLEERYRVKTHLNLPTPKGSDMSESQEKWVSYIADNHKGFEARIKVFLNELRGLSETVFPSDYPIEKCICDPTITIPYTKGIGIRIGFQCDWGDGMIGVTYMDDFSMTEWDLEMEEFYGRDLRD